ncbi:MAG TPA: hypothetical protein DIS66_04015, partial [Candidatus Omnitrophica bacterium]|nr:hypothetical protein [Candidatus Omnitrophota bacterium]
EKEEALASERAQAQIKNKELQDRLDALNRDYAATIVELKEVKEKSVADVKVIEEQKKALTETSSSLAQQHELNAQTEKKLAEQSAQSEQQMQALRNEKEDLSRKHKELEDKFDILRCDYVAVTTKLKEAEEKSVADVKVIEEQKKALTETSSSLAQQHELNAQTEKKLAEQSAQSEQQMQALRNEKEDLSRKHKELEGKLQEFSHERLALIASRTTAEQQTAAYADVIKRQRQENEKFATELNHAQAKHKELQDRIDALNRDHAVTIAELKETREKSAADTGVIEEQKKTLAETSLNFTQQRDLSAQAEKRLAEQSAQSEQQLQALRKEKEEALASERAQAQIKHKETQGRIEELSRDYAAMSARLKEAEEKNRLNLNDLESQKKELAEAISKLTEQQNLSIKKEEDQAHRLAENERQIEVLRGEREGLSQKQKSLEAKLVETQVREDAFRQERQKQQEVLEEHVKIEQGLRDKYSALEAVKNTMFTGWKDERERLAQANASLADLQSKLAAAEEEAKKWKESAALLQSQNPKPAAENKVWMIGREEDGLKNKNQILTQALDSERARAKKMEEELARLRQVIAMGQPKASAPEIKPVVLPAMPKPASGKDKVNGLELILAMEDKKEPPQNGKTK